MAKALNEMSAADVARAVAAGETTAEAVTRACLERIEARESEVHAWAHLDSDLAIAEARVLDAGPKRGPLHGVTLGVKDIIDAVGMPTGMGSPIYDGWRPGTDASCVGLARAAGAVVLGKTVTCEFAGRTPRGTANPLDPTRTPGGSSSGSAAAVADHMVHLAFGTQTAGSVLRPSAYCGIVGFKPTYNTIVPSGIKFAAVSLDTIGMHARSVDDIDLIAAALVNRGPAPERPADTPPVIGLCRTFFWEHALPESQAAVEDAAERLAALGCTVREVTLPTKFEGLERARNVINEVERWRTMQHEWATARDKLSDELAGILARGHDMPNAEYLAALVLCDECRTESAGLLDGIDAILTPTADGEPPVGLDYTGNPRFQGIWTALHVPTITLPTHTGPNGMPVGIQLIGRRFANTRLLSDSRWVEARLVA